MSEAYKALSYERDSIRQDWSAEKPDGVCICLWQKELAFHDGVPWMDTQLHCDPIETWGTKPGNGKRKKHLARAISEFDGRVDVIIVSGVPGEGYGDAEPWFSASRGAHWEVYDFDSESGHFKVRAVK